MHSSIGCPGFPTLAAHPSAPCNSTLAGRVYRGTRGPGQSTQPERTMTSRTLLTRGIRVAVLAAAMPHARRSGPRRAPPAPSISRLARWSAAGYEVGGWLALSVSLANEGEPTSGYLVAETVARIGPPLRRDASRARARS